MSRVGLNLNQPPLAIGNYKRKRKLMHSTLRLLNCLGSCSNLLTFKEFSKCSNIFCIWLGVTLVKVKFQCSVWLWWNHKSLKRKSASKELNNLSSLHHSNWLKKIILINWKIPICKKNQGYPYIQQYWKRVCVWSQLLKSSLHELILKFNPCNSQTKPNWLEIAKSAT